MTTGTVFHGVVNGNNIQLEHVHGLVQGERVVVTVQKQTSMQERLERLRALGGSLADIPGLDESLAEILAVRKNDTRRLPDFD